LNDRREKLRMYVHEKKKRRKQKKKIFPIHVKDSKNFFEKGRFVKKKMKKTLSFFFFNFKDDRK